MSERQFHLGSQNDTLYITSGEKPSTSNDYPNHDADRTLVARVFDEAEAKRLLGLQSQLAEREGQVAMLRDRINQAYRIAIWSVSDCEDGTFIIGGGDLESLYLILDDDTQSSEQWLSEQKAEWVKENALDKARLEFVLNRGVFLIWSKTDSGKDVCQLFTQDEDENYIAVSGADSFFTNGADAVDAGMATELRSGDVGCDECVDAIRNQPTGEGEKK